MSMEIGSGVTSQIMELKTSKPGVTRKEEIKTGFKSVDDYSRYLQEKYDYMNKGTVSMQGVLATVTVSNAFLEKCKDDPQKAAWLEENLAAIPNCAKMAVGACLGTLTSLQYMCDENGNLSVAISGSSDPDGKIAKENAKRKAAEERAAKEKTERKRAEKKAERERIKKHRARMAEEDDTTEDFNISIVGTDIRSITAQLSEKAGFGAMNGIVGIDLKA
ncbi:MAG: hypothetical protein K6G83_06970 [Lachnospiraceae bacterium]|nr:hypothetical protein [Lachnospiraceae bacterium]